MNIEEKRLKVLEEAEEYSVKRLARLVADCTYYLGAGDRNNNILYYKDPQPQVEGMRLFKRLIKYTKTNTTFRDIELFAQAMKPDPEVYYMGYNVRGEIWDHLPLEFVGVDGDTNIDEYIDRHWFLERYEVLDDDEIKSFYIVWIAGEVVDTFDKVFGDEILQSQEDIINQIIGGTRK